jgi:pimeloyl-ACP methyl ester carboxylesterase
MPTTVRNGVRLYFEDSGKGVAVVFHTGGGGDGRMWKLAGYTEALPSCRHILMDHRGHGQSDAPTSMSEHRMTEYVGDLIAVLDAADVESAVLIGYSGGARVALAAATTHPSRFLAVVCIGNVPSDADEGDLFLAAEVRRVGMRALMEGFAAVESEMPPKWLIDNLATTESEMFALYLEAWASVSTWGDLPNISAPTLLVSGTEECTPEEMEAAVARISQCVGLRLDGFGHLQTFWHAEVTAPVILEFLRSNVKGFPN